MGGFCTRQDDKTQRAGRGEGDEAKWGQLTDSLRISARRRRSAANVLGGCVKETLFEFLRLLELLLKFFWRRRHDDVMLLLLLGRGLLLVGWLSQTGDSQ